MLPHADIHGRRYQDALVGGQQCGCGEIIGETLRHLRHEIGGGGGCDNEIGGTGQFDVAHRGFIGEGKEIGIDRVSRKTADRKRRDKFGTRLGENAADGTAAAGDFADQLKGFIGGNAATYNEKNTLARNRHGTPLSKSIFIRNSIYFTL